MAAGFEILAHGPSPLGLLCLRRRELLGQPGTFVTEMTLNHEFLMSSFNTVSERALATHAIDMHGGDDLEVLVGGLGLGYTAHAALETGHVSRIEVIEYLPQVVGWLEEGLLPLSPELKRDSRLEVNVGDIYEQLQSTPEQTAETRYDVILIDVDHNPDEPLDGHSGAFYTRKGLERAQAHLSPAGVLAVWSSDESSPFAEALHDTFAEVQIVPIAFDNTLIDETSTDLLFLARD